MRRLPAVRLPAVLLALAAAPLGLLAPLPARAAEPAATWPQWRGPGGQGYVTDERVPLTWSEKDNLLWKTPLPGPGNSTPVVWGDRLFLTCASGNGDERLVVCVRVGDGRILWSKVASRGVEPGRTHAWNGFASASCATDGKHVYAFFGTPGLFCYDLDGNLIWKQTFGVFTSEAGWGTAASPTLFEDLVIQNCDNDCARALPPGVKAEDAAPAALVAFEKVTGRERWRTPRDRGRGFSTPLLVPVAGGRLDLVLNGPHGVCGYDPRTGKERWHADRSGDSALFGEPLPVWDADLMYVVSGRPGPCQALKLPGDGDVTQSHLVWSGVRKGHRDVASPILWQGLVYGADKDGRLSCHELKTGKELYNNERLDRGGGKSLASPIALRGKLLWVLDDGVTVVVEPGPTFRASGRNTLGTGAALDFNASPAVADGKLFLRSQTHLYCAGEKK